MRFWQARHPPRYAAFLISSSPSFPHSSLHAPYPDLRANIAPGGMLHALAANRRLLFYCAFGERSAMAVQAAQDARLGSACHLHGGLDAWKKAQGPLDWPLPR